jgi:hypothetical protein
VFQPPVYGTVLEEEQVAMARTGKARQYSGMYMGRQVVSEAGYVLRSLQASPEVLDPDRLE